MLMHEFKREIRDLSLLYFEVQLLDNRYDLKLDETKMRLGIL